MTPSQLKINIAVHHPNSHFFDRDTMRFFGDTIANFGVRRATVSIEGIKVPAWELYRRRPVKHGLDRSAFFDVETFSQIRQGEIS